MFDGLDLVVPAGTSMAIVGANGAGKTTLVKLLARLYEPSGGRIVVDGVDVRELDVDSWRSRLAVIFQDFVRYELPAADNVGLGGLRCSATGRRCVRPRRGPGRWSASRSCPRAGTRCWPAATRTAVDLSGGEWQRIALARALLAVDAGAAVLALDEPTANLDVRAEAELFDRFLDSSRPASRPCSSPTGSPPCDGPSGSACSTHGRVVELGDHDELVAAGGCYARMFGLQAARFDG